MNYKVDYKGLEAYTNRLSQRLVSDYFAREPYITGKEILNFTPIAQINFFIFRNLFTSWIEETNKFRSPFFDFENTEVQKALNEFMNQLSHHIKIKEKYFEPLLYNAIYDTLELVLNPLHFLKTIYIAREKEKYVDIDKLKKSCKYLKINDFLIVELLEYFKDGRYTREEVEERLIQIFKKNEDKLYSPYGFINEISRLESAVTSDFIIEENQGPFGHKISKESVPDTVVKNNNTPVVKEKSEKEEVDFEEKTFNRSFAEDIPTSNLNDRFKEEPKETIADELKKTSTQTTISLNQKFKFINNLFDGDKDAYELMILSLDDYKDYEELSDFLIINYAGQYNWDKKEDEVGEFFDILARRF